MIRFPLYVRLGSSQGTWPPVVKWYDDGNQEVSSGPGTASGNTVRQETLRTATEEMQLKSFRCHTLYNEPDPPSKVGKNSTTHIFSTMPPIYEENKLIQIFVDCKYNVVERYFHVFRASHPNKAILKIKLSLT